MSFLRRILGGGEKPADQRPADKPAGPASVAEPAGPASVAEPAGPASVTAAVDAEAARERELLIEEAHRLDNDLIQRQMRYADRAWTPPAQGGTRRAEDGDAGDAGPAR